VHDNAVLVDMLGVGGVGMYPTILCFFVESRDSVSSFVDDLFRNSSLKKLN